MESQNQNLQDHRSGNYNAQEANLNRKVSMLVTEEGLSLDNRICYKIRREELNKRVQSVLEQKKQIASRRN